MDLSRRSNHDAVIDFFEDLRRLPGTPFLTNIPAARWPRAVRALLGLSDNRAVYGKTSLEAIESALRHSTRTLVK